jgi:hypothetical protein
VPDPETDFAEDEYRGYESERPKRPWVLIVAALLLVVLVVAVWAKWSESRTESQQLRAELKAVYIEAETLRTQANQAQQQVGLLEQQVRSLTAERTEILRRLEAAGGEQPTPVKPKATKSPARKRPAPSRISR